MAAQDTIGDLSVELFPGKLYRLGGVAPIHDDISWIPKGVTGYVPLNCYLLLEDEGAALVETGVALNGEVIAQQLNRLLRPGQDFQLFVTRFEPDTLSNMPLLMSQFGMRKISGGGVTNPFDFFDDLSSQEQLRADYRAELSRLRPGDVVTVSPSRHLDLVVTTLRLLTTFWAYDAQTKTLFTSDTFGHAELTGASQPAVLTAETDVTTFEQVRDHLLTKFDWLKGAETKSLLDDLDRIFDTYEVDMIAPDSGCVIKGRNVVARHVSMVKQVLSEIKN
jgi:flavorubredoxin